MNDAVLVKRSNINGDLAANSRPSIDPEAFAADGYALIHSYIDDAECRRYLSIIDEYRQTHEVPAIVRKTRGRSLNYKVITGTQIDENLPAVADLYRRVNDSIDGIFGNVYVPLANKEVAVNVNITPPGGEYRWHYDRNRITAILYLNSVSGGETECFPNYRVLLGRFRYSALQQFLDSLLKLKWVRRVFGKLAVIEPSAGTMLIMRADRCLHSVRPVEGEKDRINVIMSFDLPDAEFPVEKKLDAYLYRKDADASGDPNYSRSTTNLELSPISGV